MKRAFLCALSLFAGGGLSASHGVDGKQFLDPYLQDTISAVSVNIGKNLPSTTHVVTHREGCRVVGLTAHLQSFAKRLSENETALISAPASYGVLFTDGVRSDEEVLSEIESVLHRIGGSTEPEVITSQLSSLQDVLRAAFVRRGDSLVLVTNEKDLRIGEPIWYKTSDGVEENVYHSEEEYLVSLRNAGLHVDEIKRPCFFGEVKWKMYNSAVASGAGQPLGPAYQENHPFTLYYVRKA